MIAVPMVFIPGVKGTLAPDATAKTTRTAMATGRRADMVMAEEKEADRWCSAH